LKRRISKWLSIILPLLLGFFLIVYKYNEFTPEQLTEMKSHFRNADYLYIGISLFIALFGFLSRAYRWKYSLEYLGYQTTFKNNLMSVCISYFINLTIPRSGEITRAVIINKYENVPFDKAFGTIVAERVVDFGIFLLFVFASLVFQFDVLRHFISKNIPIDDLMMYLGIAVAAFIGFVLLWVYSRWKYILVLKEKVSGLMEGMICFRKPRDRIHEQRLWGVSASCG
jgi:uncharacterized protein (TIRG00374 family)